ncbi:MAG: hypothetical protein IIX91_01350, partial [Clostridia bacterium]|nr:hypothetical protein [Clostridia bacterium]
MKIGLSTCGFTPTEEAFKNLAAAGIHAVELSMEKGYMDALDFSAVKNYADTYGVEISMEKGYLDALDLEELKANADAYGVELWSCHLPYYPFTFADVSSTD